MFSQMIIEAKLVDKILLCFNSGEPSLQNLKDIFNLVKTLCNHEFSDILNLYDEVKKFSNNFF